MRTDAHAMAVAVRQDRVKIIRMKSCALHERADHLEHLMPYTGITMPMRSAVNSSLSCRMACGMLTSSLSSKEAAYKLLPVPVK